MSRDELIAMAREAGAITGVKSLMDVSGGSIVFALEELERFAALVEAKAAANERDACAQVAAQTVCDTHIPTGVKIYGSRAAKAIRKRGNT